MYFFGLFFLLFLSLRILFHSLHFFINFFLVHSFFIIISSYSFLPSLRFHCYSFFLIANRWINDTDNWIYDEEDTDKPMLCGNLTGARHCPTGRLTVTKKPLAPHTPLSANRKLHCAEKHSSTEEREREKVKCINNKVHFYYWLNVFNRFSYTC